MMNKTHNLLKSIFIVACSIPFLTNLPYMTSAWRMSNLDRLDWIFIILFVVNGSFQLGRFLSSRKPDFDYYASIPVLMFLGGYVGFKYIYDVHAIAIASSIAFWWSCSWLLYGWKSAFCLLPSFMILMLGCTSSTYWLSYAFMMQSSSALATKFIAAGCFIVWDFYNRYFTISRGTLCFILVLLGALVLFMQAKNMNERSKPFILNFDQLQLDSYLGREMQVPEDTKRFFVNSEVKQYSFADSNTFYSVLAVRCLNDIHEIHPASHCLRTSDGKIISEYSLVYNIHGEDIILNEIQVIMRGLPLLVAVWYSNEEFSTGNFLGFRRAWNPEKKWMTYQISTPLVNNDVSQARNNLIAFLNAIPSNLTENKPAAAVGTEQAPSTF